MNRETYRRVRQVFHSACELEPRMRASYLDEACVDEPEIRRQVEALFALEASPPSPGLDLPAPEASVLRSLVASEAGGTPRSIGRYRVLEPIGEGGFGTVFLAEQTEPVVRRVALKIIKAGMDSAQVIARFEAERQALAMMDHPGIARVLDAGATDDGRPFFVMELVRGEPVTDHCDRARLTVRERLQLFRDICGAVQHAHQKGIIHRDLKPTNVLVTAADGRPLPKVIDFGVSKAIAGRLTDRTLVTDVHQLIGTPQYMSPEQASLAGTDIDTRSDIYSLGVLLYELLAGATPLDRRRLRSASLPEMQHMIREEEPPRPSERLTALLAGKDTGESPSDVPPRACATEIAVRRGTEPAALARSLRGDLDWIVMKCLEKDRDRRFDTAGALAEDLGRYLDGLPVLASPPSSSYRLRKFVRRNRPAVAASLAILVTLVCASGVSIGFGVSEARQHRLAEADRARAERAERDAQTRADELEQVVRFQSEQFSSFDAERMGSDLRAELIAKARMNARRSLSPEDAELRVAELVRLTQGLDFTGLALGALDDSVFGTALAAVERQFSEQPLIEAQLLQSLASTLRLLGMLESAVSPQREALEIRRRVLGNEHPETVASILETGLLLQARGRLPEAEACLQEALEACRSVLGDEDPTTLVAIDAMGLHLRTKGDFAAAETLYREGLEKSRRVLGAEHPDTLGSLNNMGALLTAQDRLAEAEPYFRDALQGYRRVLGEDDPDTLLSIHNMGSLLHAEGRLAEAEPYYREALEKRRRVLGDEHPDTLQSINGMGVLLHAEGRLAEAEPFYLEALELRTRVLGDEHARTLNSLNNMAGLLKDQGRLDEAEAFYSEALEKRRRVLGEKHPDTINSLHNMGWLLEGQGKLAEAEVYFREAVEKDREVLGAEHSDTLLSIGNLSSVLLDLGRPAEASALLEPAEPAMRRAFTGGYAVRLGRFLGVLGRARVALGELDAAEADLTEALAILESADNSTNAMREQVLTGLVALYEAWHAAGR